MFPWYLKINTMFSPALSVERAERGDLIPRRL